MRYLQLLLLTITLACFSTIELKAQDKYEFAAVRFIPRLAYGYYYINIYRNGKEVEAIKIDLTKEQRKDMLLLYNSLYPVLLNKVAEMSKDGWEVINAVEGSSGFPTYYLKRKLK